MRSTRPRGTEAAPSRYQASSRRIVSALAGLRILSPAVQRRAGAKHATPCSPPKPRAESALAEARYNPRRCAQKVGELSSLIIVWGTSMRRLTALLLLVAAFAGARAATD